MNFLGKILVVANLVFTILLMSISVFVYATHRNWYEAATDVSKQLQQAKAENEASETRYRRLDSQLKLEIEASLQDVRKLETERETLIAESATTQSQLDQLLQKDRSNTQAVASTQANNEKLTAEVQTLRDSLREIQAEIDVTFRTMVASTDLLHEVQGQYNSGLERQKQLVADLANKNILLNENGLDPNADPGAVVPRVRGVISATHRTANSQLIELTVGADDGLKRGHTVEVFRGDRYLGRAEILRTEPDRAVGRILRRFQQGQIQEGDHVATKLRVG